MLQFLNKRMVFFLILSAMTLLVSKHSHAFTISPVRYLVTIDTGSSQVIGVRVQNDENEEKVFKFSVLGAEQDEKGQPIFKKGIDTAEAWVKPENESVVIKPNEEKEVRFSITVPGGSGPGAHYLGLAVEEQGRVGEVGLSGRLLTLLNLQVAGMVREHLEIAQWQAKHKIAFQKKWPFDLELKNNSNIDVSLEGGAVVCTWTGKEIFRQPIKISSNLLPDTGRALEAQVNAEEIFWPGYYKVKSVVVYGRTQQMAEADEGVLYAPWWSLLVLVFVFGLIVWRVRRFFRSFEI